MIDKPPNTRIRVAVVDDSPTERMLMVSLFKETADFEVVGVGQDGMDAIKFSRDLRPDIIVMDVVMPKVNGLEATAHIMHEHPTPIALMSSTLNPMEMNLAFEAQRAGALTALEKPSLANTEACESFLRTVKVMSKVPLVRRWTERKMRVPAITGTLPASNTSRERDALTREQKERLHIIGIASSTGGPSVLLNILQALTPEFPMPILIVQHISRGFGVGLAEWLDSELMLNVKLAQDGMKPKPGTVYIAPDDYHLEINMDGTLHLQQQPPYRGLRPSANYLFESLAKVCGKYALGIILTGMGDDGADGLLHLYQAGGVTIAQDRSSCTVYGMPMEAVQKGAVDVVLNPDQINYTLHQLSVIRSKPVFKG